MTLIPNWLARLAQRISPQAGATDLPTPAPEYLIAQSDDDGGLSDTPSAQERVYDHQWILLRRV